MRSGRRAGFTVIELVVSIGIVVLLAWLSHLQYQKLLEREKLDEGLRALERLRVAQEAHLAKVGAYCTEAFALCPDWTGETSSELEHFTAPVDASVGASNPSWKTSIQRKQPHERYGRYTIVYHVRPDATPSLNCSDERCAKELLAP